MNTPWEDMSSDEKNAEWRALSDREREQFRCYRDARKELKELVDYINRVLSDYDYTSDLIGRTDAIRRALKTWAGQKWVAAVDEVMETRIDCEPVRLAAA